MANRTMPVYQHQEFPKQIWHPQTGELKVVGKEADIPTGWLARHPDDPAHDREEGPLMARPGDKLAEPTPAAGALDEQPMTRDEIIAELREYKVQFNTRASTADLAAMLVKARGAE